MATVNDVSTESLKKAFDEQSNDPADLYGDLEDALGSLNFINPDRHQDLMRFTGNTSHASALEFGMPGFSNLNRNIFQKIKSWICAHYAAIKDVLDKIANAVDQAEKDQYVADLLKILKGIPVLGGIVSTVEFIARIIALVAHILVKYGLPAMCPVPAI